MNNMNSELVYSASMARVLGAGVPETEDGAEKVQVSFAYGTVIQAAADDYPGGISFGHDSAVGAGAIYRMGKLVTGKVLDFEVEEEDDKNSVSVTCVDTDGAAIIKNFECVTPEYIDSALANIEQDAYFGSEYVKVDGGEVSLKYADLYGKMKNDLAADGLGDETEVNEQQSKRISDIEKSYVAGVTEIDIDDEDKKEYAFSISRSESIADETEVEELIINVPSNVLYTKVNATEQLAEETSDEVETLKTQVAEMSGVISRLLEQIGILTEKVAELEQDWKDISSDDEGSDESGEEGPEEGDEEPETGNEEGTEEKLEVQEWENIDDLLK